MAVSKIKSANVIETLSTSDIDNLVAPGIYGTQGDIKAYNDYLLLVLSAGGRIMQISLEPYNMVIKARCQKSNTWKNWVTIFDQSS